MQDPWCLDWEALAAVATAVGVLLALYEVFRNQRDKRREGKLAGSLLAEQMMEPIARLSTQLSIALGHFRGEPVAPPGTIVWQTQVARFNVGSCVDRLKENIDEFIKFGASRGALFIRLYRCAREYNLALDRFGELSVEGRDRAHFENRLNEIRRWLELAAPLAHEAENVVRELTDDEYIKRLDK